MSVNCSPSALVSASAEFREIRGARIPAAKLYLLRAIAGLDELSPQELIEASSCFMQCVSVGAYKAVESYLLCQIANGGSGDCQNLAGVDSPLNNVTPDFIGQVYVQEDGTIWQAGSLLDSSWVTICTPGTGSNGLVWGPNPDVVDSINADQDAFLTDLDTGFGGVDLYTTLSFENPITVTNDVLFTSSTKMTSLEMGLESVGGSLTIQADVLESLLLADLQSVGSDFKFTNCPLLTLIDISSLVSVGLKFDASNPSMTSISAPLLATVGDDFLVESCAALTSLSFPSLTSVGLSLQCDANSLLASVDFTSLQTVGGQFLLDQNALTAISLPALTTVNNGMDFSDNSVLAFFSAPLWLPTDGTVIEFQNCALDATSVNHILARCVASGVTTCSIDLSGGTNAAPTGQGITDKADLITAGNTVTTN